LFKLYDHCIVNKPLVSKNIVCIVLFTEKEEMVYEACGNQDYEEVVKCSEKSVQELQVYVCGCNYGHDTKSKNSSFFYKYMWI
jgi:hypothetical protein